MGAFNTNPFNTTPFGGGVSASTAGITLGRLAYQAARDLGCIRAGQTLGSDILQDILEAGNQMLDGWLIEDFLLPESPAQVFPLVAGTQIYTIGPNEVAPNFTAPRPTEIVLANIILNTVTPVLRLPLEIINEEQWASIPVQLLPNTIPTRMYYEKSFDIVTGASRILLWGGAITSYQLEIYAWDQSVLRQFADVNTAYLYPPGYANLIRKSLAVAIAPLMNMSSKAARMENLLAPSPDMLARVEKQALLARESVESYNADAPILTGDPMFQSDSRRPAFNYLTGANGRNNI